MIPAALIVASSAQQSAVDISVIVAGIASVVFGFIGYVTAVVVRRRRVTDASDAMSIAEIARLAGETMGAKITEDMKEQFKTINDHLIFQDRRSQQLGERVARIEGKLGLNTPDET